MNIKLLVFISVLGSVFTIYTTKIGFGEVYPFTSWKLFPKPACGIDHCELWIIKSLNQKNDTINLQIKAFKGFDYDDAHYAFDNFIGNFLNQPNKENRNRFFMFLKKMHPKHNVFILQRKSFNLEEFAKNENQFEITENHVFEEN
ncbi:MAG: hypothetical protein SNJ77_05175 [Cytophagales bacterium]